MKKLLTYIPAIVALIICITPAISDAQSSQSKTNKQINTYTLSDESSFEGTEQEYQYAEFILDVESDIDSYIEDAWNATAKKYKFPTTATILKTAKFKGDAGYNAQTKEYYVSNSKGGEGYVVIEVKHRLSRAKLNKMINTFSKEIEKSLTQAEKDAGVSIKKVRKDSDLEDMMSVFEDTMYDVGYALGRSLKQTFVDVEGTTNKNIPVSILTFTDASKDTVISDEERKTLRYELPSSAFSEFLMYEQPEVLYRPVYVVIGVDQQSPANTKVTFKVSDIRQLSALTAFDIWGE